MKRYVDTNILVRIMSNDVPTLARKAIDEVERAGRGELIIPEEVLAELFFVLEFNQLYSLDRNTIALLFQDILLTPQFLVSRQAKEAFHLYAKHPKLDFVDCLLAAKGTMKRSNVLTFDKALQRVLK